jgi:hypothetical protein
MNIDRPNPHNNGKLQSPFYISSDLSPSRISNFNLVPVHDFLGVGQEPTHGQPKPQTLVKMIAGRGTHVSRHAHQSSTWLIL